MDDYFSPEAILATEPRIYTTLHTRGHNLAHLDAYGASAHWSAAGPPSPSPPHVAAPRRAHDHTADLPPGHRLPLPLWLAEALAERGAAVLELPRCFSASARHALRADARAVRLSRKCPAYYGVGVRLASLLRDAALPASLIRAFAARCWVVVDSAAFAGERGVEALDGLEERERDLFFSAHGLDLAVKRWKERRAERIVSGVDAVLGKRRRDVGSPVTPGTAAKR